LIKGNPAPDSPVLFFFLVIQFALIVQLCGCALMSAPFHISCGVRQGGVLSSFILSICGSAYY